MNHEATLAAGRRLVSAYRSAGRAAEPVTLCETDVTECERIYGRNHAVSATARNNLANAQNEADRAAGVIQARRANYDEQLKSSMTDIRWSEPRPLVWRMHTVMQVGFQTPLRFTSEF